MKLRALQFSVGDLNLNSETYIGSGGCQILKINTVTMKKFKNVIVILNFIFVAVMTSMSLQK